MSVEGLAVTVLLSATVICLSWHIFPPAIVYRSDRIIRKFGWKGLSGYRDLGFKKDMFFMQNRDGKTRHLEVYNFIEKIRCL